MLFPVIPWNILITHRDDRPARLEILIYLDEENSNKENISKKNTFNLGSCLCSNEQYNYFNHKRNRFELAGKTS